MSCSDNLLRFVDFLSYQLIYTVFKILVFTVFNLLFMAQRVKFMTSLQRDATPGVIIQLKSAALSVQESKMKRVKIVEGRL